VGATDAEQKKIFSFERWDVIIAMSVAGIVNIAMLTIAAAVFNGRGIGTVQTLDQAFTGLGVQLGNGADIFFGLGLLASGLSSSSVGTLAGQVVMQGFIQRKIPLFLRRAITMAPALIVIAIGVDPTRALVLSQVVLSFGIPFALIPLLMFCRDRNLMGTLVNHRVTTLIATAVVAVIVSLNVFLISLLIGGH
jgi:manganese transport protein